MTWKYSFFRQYLNWQILALYSTYIPFQPSDMYRYSLQSPFKTTILSTLDTGSQYRFATYFGIVLTSTFTRA